MLDKNELGIIYMVCLLCAQSWWVVQVFVDERSHGMTFLQMSVELGFAIEC